MKKELLKNFSDHFKNYDYVNTSELMDFLSTFYVNLSKSSFLWKVFELKKQGIITKITNEKYRINLQEKKKSFPILLDDNEITHVLRSFNQFIYNNYLINSKKDTSIIQEAKKHGQLNEANNILNIDENIISIWNLNVLNSFTNHQYSQDITFIDIDKYRIDSLFFQLKDALGNHYYITKDYRKDFDHIFYEHKVIILSPLLKRSPLDKKSMLANHLIIPPKMEKIIVDMYAQKDTLKIFDKMTIKEIIMNYYEKFNLDFTTLLYYAKNRGIKDELKSLLSQCLEVKFDD